MQRLILALAATAILGSSGTAFAHHHHRYSEGYSDCGNCNGCNGGSTCAPAEAPSCCTPPAEAPSCCAPPPAPPSCCAPPPVTPPSCAAPDGGQTPAPAPPDEDPPPAQESSWTDQDQQSFVEIFGDWSQGEKDKMRDQLKGFSRADRDAAFSDARKIKREESEKARPQNKSRTSTTPRVSKSTIVVHFYPFAPESPIVAATSPSGAR
jgi:hypothetical protein